LVTGGPCETIRGLQQRQGRADIWLFGFRGGERSASDWLVSLAVK
jgi:hypothetical protein